jgi:hypothetical protein
MAALVVDGSQTVRSLPAQRFLSEQLTRDFSKLNSYRLKPVGLFATKSRLK